MKNQKTTTAFKILSILFFILFLFEVLYLNQHNLSFRGIYTEKVFFYSSILAGCIGFGFTRFLRGCIIFIFLTMLPMMIPFLFLIGWSITTPTAFPQADGSRLESHRPLGPMGHNTLYISSVEPYAFLLEKKTTIDLTDHSSLFENNTNNPIDFSKLQVASLKLVQDTTAVDKIRLEYRIDDKSKVVELSFQ